MTTAIATTINLIPSRKFITSFLAVLLFCFAVLYMYLLTTSVVHVVMRKEAVQNIHELESEIASLETKFMLAQHNVSDAIVVNQKYSETSEKIFVSRSKSVAVAVFAE